MCSKNGSCDCSQPCDNCECETEHACRNCEEMVAESDLCECCSECDGCCDCEECFGCSVTLPCDDVCDECGKCDDCCECSTCDCCGRNIQYDQVCSNCKECYTCCECHFCNDCWERVDSDDHCSCCDCCDNCCECEVCDSCGDRCRSDDYCFECHRCHDNYHGGGCCDCCYCSGCDNYCDSDNFCHDCDYCSLCCECEDGKYRYLYTTTSCSSKLHQTFHEATWRDHKRNRSKRFISTEIETNSLDTDCTFKLEQLVRKWDLEILPDGSITGPEIVLAPAVGDVYVREVYEVCEALKYASATVDASCGLHVHVDTRDFGWYDLRRLIFFYSHLQDTFYKMVPKSRLRGHNGDHFCKPLDHDLSKDLMFRAPRPHDTKLAIINDLYGNKSSYQESKNQKYAGDRYRGLNLHSWVYRGSVEFRFPNATTNPEKVLGWALLLANMVDFAHDASESQLHELCSEIDGLKLLLFLANDDDHREWILERYNKFSKSAVKYAGRLKSGINSLINNNPLNTVSLPCAVSSDSISRACA